MRKLYVTLALTLCFLGGIAQPSPPNVVLIMVDDMGWNSISCYGEKPWKTPHIDQLAEEGVRFTQAYASPVCSPTRASILTGKNPARLRITNWIPGWAEKYANPKMIEKPFAQALPLSERTIAEALREGGYATAMIGKWHVGDGLLYTPDKQGFDYHYMVSFGNLSTWFVDQQPKQLTGFYRDDTGDRQFLTEHLVDQAEEWLEKQQEKPFFLYFSTHVVHRPIAAKNNLIEKYLTQGLPAQGSDAADYAAMHQHMDDAIGRLLHKLDVLGVSDNTVVIFLSDNGGREPQTDNAPFRGGKGELLEGGIRVPLIVKWPGVTKRKGVSDTPVITDDLYPTLLEMANLRPTSPPLDGLSVVNLLKNPEDTLRRDALFWHYPHYNGKPYGKPSSAVRQGNWKLLEVFESDTLALYDLQTDPGEQLNMAREHPEIVAELQTTLSRWRTQLEVQMPDRNPAYDPTAPSGWPAELAK